MYLTSTPVTRSQNGQKEAIHTLLSYWKAPGTFQFSLNEEISMLDSLCCLRLKFCGIIFCCYQITSLVNLLEHESAPIITEYTEYNFLWVLASSGKRKSSGRAMKGETRNFVTFGISPVEKGLSKHGSNHLEKWDEGNKHEVVLGVMKLCQNFMRSNQCQHFYITRKYHFDGFYFSEK